MLLVASLVVSSCGPRESPARTQLRERLRQSAKLSNEELGQLRAEVTGVLTGRALAIAGPPQQDLDSERRDLIFGMLAEQSGMFDEGLKTRGDSAFRVLNSPAPSQDAELESFRKLWINVETFLPGRFELTRAFGGEQESLDLVVVAGK